MEKVEQKTGIFRVQGMRLKGDPNSNRVYAELKYRLFLHLNAILDDGREYQVTYLGIKPVASMFSNSTEMEEIEAVLSVFLISASDAKVGEHLVPYWRVVPPSGNDEYQRHGLSVFKKDWVSGGWEKVS